MHNPKPQQSRQYKSLCTFFGIRYGLHADKKFLVEINGRNNIYCVVNTKKKLAQKTTPAQKKQQLIYLKEH